MSKKAKLESTVNLTITPTQLEYTAIIAARVDLLRRTGKMPVELDTTRVVCECVAFYLQNVDRIYSRESNGA
jgi:hypothetical protein